jgi:hypothetical protein
MRGAMVGRGLALAQPDRRVLVVIRPATCSTLMRCARATLFAGVAITADGAPCVLPPRDGALLKTRFSPRHWC